MWIYGVRIVSNLFVIHVSKNKARLKQDQTSKGRSFQLASCRPPLSAQRNRNRRPTLANVFWVRHSKGEFEAFCIGGVLLKEDTRVETANEYGFSSPYSNGREEREESQKAHRFFFILLKQAFLKTKGIISFVVHKETWKAKDIRRNGTGKYTVHPPKECEPVANRLALFLGMVV